MGDRGWKRPFSRSHIVCRAAANSSRSRTLYITKLSKADQEAAEWQAGMEALILVATLGGRDGRADRNTAGAEPRGAKSRHRPALEIASTPIASRGLPTLASAPP